jgi:hypothetical protein
LTIPDVITALVVLFFLGGLYPIYEDSMSSVSVSPGVQLLAVFLLPLAILVMYHVIFRRALGVGK